MANVTTGKMQKRYTKKSFVIKNIPIVEDQITIDGDRKTFNKGCARINIDFKPYVLNIYVKKATETHKVGGDDGDGKEINFYATIVGVKKKTYRGNYSGYTTSYSR